ncbi:hypothetical protein BVRB_4g072990 [Beta vulgaris subsp. vulgaris]|nr:hypothetical protein BVRB_4g072990 [Beta vulgaris subsp. vulgaris]
MEKTAERNGKKVCVTGASGYIASWLVNFLLQRGYTVNATVRDPYDSRKTEHLLGLKGAKERLHLYKADLMDEGSFDAAVAGCEGVFHTASPVNFDAKDPQVDLLDPAVKGTLNVLVSCKKFPTIRRVILTSSTATSIFTGTTLAPDVMVDETWFSDPEICKGSNMMSYALSKVLAEEAAWKFAKENDIDMVSINPSMVIGPMLQSTVNDSVASILNLINGSESYPDLVCPWVHVKDVVEAHIRAFEIPSAAGRYILAERVLHFSDVLKILHQIYPSFKLPNKCVDVGPLPKICYQVSKSKAKSLGIEYTPFEVSLRDTVESLKAKNFV